MAVVLHNFIPIVNSNCDNLIFIATVIIVTITIIICFIRLLLFLIY